MKKLKFRIVSCYEQSVTPEITFTLYSDQPCHDLISMSIYMWPKDWPDISMGIFVMFENHPCFYETLAILCEEPFLLDIEEEVGLIMTAQEPSGCVHLSLTQYESGAHTIPFNESYMDCVSAARKCQRRKRRCNLL